MSEYAPQNEGLTQAGDAARAATRRAGRGGGMTRRATLAGLAALGGQAGARAQQSERQRRIGILMPYPADDAEIRDRVDAFKRELARMGWHEGSRVEIIERWATDDLARIRAEAAELVRTGCDLILTTGSRVVPILQQLTRTIPIIFVGTSDPAGQGFVGSLARPGGNTTGFSLLEFDGTDVPIIGKMLELLTLSAPTTKRVTLLYNAANPASRFYDRFFVATVERMGLRAISSPLRGNAEIEPAIAAAAAEPGSAMLLPSDLSLLAQRKLITDLATHHRLPTIYSDRVFAEAGGLIAYSADREEMFGRAAGYADRIFRGENPGELPVQQPTRYELVVNLRAARAIGLTIPDIVMLRADEVID